MPVTKKADLTKGLILDRDGTLIDIVRDEETGAVFTAFHPRQLRLLPGVVAGLRAAQEAGFVLAIATNQPGVAKGHFSREAVTRTNDALVALLADEGVRIAAVATCLHHPTGASGGDESLWGPCACRKPLPGLFDDLVTRLGLDRAASFGVGDNASDVEAARAAGLRGVLLLGTRCDLCPLRGAPSGSTVADDVARNLLDVAAVLRSG